jgi:hypothetical protein
MGVDLRYHRDENMHQTSFGEHRELHAIWNILTQNKSGYSRHPETLRWKGKLAALYLRHEELVYEMISRNYHHKTELDRKYAEVILNRINL